MKNNLILSILLTVVIGASLFGGDVHENTTYAKTILERNDSVSTYFQQVVEPFSLKNGPVQLTAVPLLSETYLLSEYPDMKNKRYSTSKMLGLLGFDAKALDRQQEMNGTFIVFLRYERDEELLGLSSFTIDFSFFDYMFLDNDKGEFLRVSSHTIGRVKTVDASNTVLEFWVTFGENEEERKEFFQGSESVSISVSDFGFEDQTINYPLPLSKMFLNIPKEIKEIQMSIRSSLKITFDGADKPVLTGQMFGTVISEPEKPSRTGYTFDGWYKDALHAKAWDFKKDVLLDDIMLYAKWTSNEYVVTFDRNGGLGGTESIVVRTGSSMPYAIAPNREGYIFAGYYDGLDGKGAAYYSNQMKSLKTWDKGEPVKLYAKWIGLKTVKFDSNGGNPISPIFNIAPGSSIAEPEIPHRDGQVFEGWYKDPGTSIQWDFKRDKIIVDMTLYAKWRELPKRDIGPAGGYVFYDKGAFYDGWRYLEAAPAEYEFKDKVWGGPGTTVGGTYKYIGRGESNTRKIVAAFGDAEPSQRNENRTDYAAKVCADLVVTKDGVAYDDWFLPSRDELREMYIDLHRNNLGGFSDDIYWSSSESNAFFAWSQDFSNSDWHTNVRFDEIRVRPVRAF